MADAVASATIDPEIVLALVDHMRLMLSDDLWKACWMERDDAGVRTLVHEALDRFGGCFRSVLRERYLDTVVPVVRAYVRLHHAQSDLARCERRAELAEERFGHTSRHDKDARRSARLGVQNTKRLVVLATAKRDNLQAMLDAEYTAVRDCVPLLPGAKRARRT